MGAARTLFEKVWASHVVRSGPGGHDLLYVDRHLVHEGSFHAFERLRERGRRVRRPHLRFATADHYVPTTDRREATPDPEIRVRDPDGTEEHPFDIDPFRKQGLLVGRDEIGVTLTHEVAIRSFEARRSEETPWVFPAAGDPAA